ncbi:MAG: outer membrane protein assembly factor BamA [Ignavibacteria bacterium GWB2_35_12]|nr:MAG: outer membrane protein assembly factor BamA [Ignavibacteria bacterium GWA2_35_8]OGU38644.1 MAG: outer membrane protein assembly factor BamA [Ignavibacteria bacterium GWB2_35_12]OGU94022.1 MAG: outer membrane protein assembly factor BamA [Ignavibacteria bacterium RIFOXYA2_FULL_35_10]OGV22879.1 MAG: outer membrane protein assembly factor BamA [Ignavibacteria bacterium RIFOXYC2_FULL_35_21]
MAGIQVEGNKFADEQTIIALSGLVPRDRVKLPNDNKFQIAMKNLWNRKQFSDVEIVIDKITPLGIFLTIKVKEYTRLSEIIIEGNKELTRDEIIKVIGKVKGDVLTPYELYLARQSIKKKYTEEGLLFAKVEAEIEPTDTSYYSKMIISVNEGTEFFTGSIEFEGNKNFSDADLASEFDDTHTKEWWQFWRSSKFDTKEYETDKELLKTFFRKEGYIDAEILKDTIIYDEKKSELHIKLWIEEGKKYYIRNIEFDGNTVYPSQLLLARLDFKKGDVYDQDKFEKNLNGNEDQTDVLSLYADNGYLSIRFIPEEVRINPDSVDIKIKVYENQRLKIRRVEIVGNNKTKDKVIRRELYTRPGDYFDRSAVIRSVRALGVMNYFNPEALRPDVRPVDEGNIDLIYRVEEKSNDMVNASIGFAGSFGLTGSVGVTFNNFSITEPLSGGGGQIFNIQAEFGQANRYQTYAIGFTEPWLFDEPTTVGFNLYYRDIKYFYNQKSVGFATNLGRRFRWPDDYFRGDLRLRIQNNVADSIYLTRPGLEVTLGQSISRISLNHPFFPTYGSRFSFSTDFAMGALGVGAIDYLKNELKFEMVHPLLKIDDNDRMVLYLSTNLGYITGITNDTTFPPVELYYMGGSGLSGYFGTIPFRGYPDNSIGPNYGGKVMAKYTAELRFALSMNPMPVYIYGFAEAGNVWYSLKETDPFNLKRSAGLGLQINLAPIGIIGFSYGYGFDPAGLTGEKSGWKFLFHLGQQ